MMLIRDILIDENVATAKFSCDVGKCKGACCTLAGGGGAPLLDEEVPIMRELYAVVKEYLPDTSRKVVRKQPVTGTLGEYETTCVDNRECCFVFFENGIAKCSIEKAYFEGKTNFRKPISCHLFPIRVGDFGGSYIFYEQFRECEPGRAKGADEGVYLLDELQVPLERAFGGEWAKELNKHAENIRTRNAEKPQK